jgi:uroporphyrinogen-III synthase
MSTPRIFVLSTQTLSAGLTGVAAASGVQLDTVPFIRTEPVEAGELPTGAMISVFTSQHAVEALPAIGPEWRVFCIEGATRKMVERRFGAGVIAGTAASAEELARVIIDAGRDAPGVKSGRQVYFFCGDLRRGELPALLREAGFVVAERIVYRTVLTPQRVERDYAGIVFFSPSGVESFFSVNNVAADTALFAIGRTTAVAVRKWAGREPMIASKPDKEILINQMISHFNV